MNRWLQRKLYECPNCGTEYLHDRGYQHTLFQCPQRHVQVGQGERTVMRQVSELTEAGRGDASALGF